MGLNGADLTKKEVISPTAPVFLEVSYLSTDAPGLKSHRFKSI